MAEYVALSGGQGEEAEPVDSKAKRRRIASLDVFRGLSIAVLSLSLSLVVASLTGNCLFLMIRRRYRLGKMKVQITLAVFVVSRLMIFVDYAGSVFPFVAHSPWHGVRLADFVTPFFLFIAGISLSLVYKKASNKLQATQQAVLRALELFLLGILLQGGYFHGVNSLSFGIDVEKIRWSGILQRIAVGYVVAAVCEIWLSNTPRNAGHVGVFFRNYFLHWIVLVSLSGIYLGLLYGLYVPDWQFEVQQANLSDFYKNSTFIIKKVNCGVKGDLGPACNSAGMIDRYVLGIEHLYKKSAYRNLKVCQNTEGGDFSDNLPSWCQAPFDPEGILGTQMELFLGGGKTNSQHRAAIRSFLVVVVVERGNVEMGCQLIEVETGRLRGRKVRRWRS
ncbi:hypothetical protein IEQ34_000210 [Dendrobium chrysotoxum]|uniref:Heparan-alpha-glucosaminide N-acetyltransferase catalytic domain-containing protein n=1 Tax=Dendrobium chrysotoxum TaxID=161865 RepID=A0AAV7HNZ2_DENCH|nr:hypothetical protein IEQ34_000210 [Dendrobium chrysotoxum]